MIYVHDRALGVVFNINSISNSELIRMTENEPIIDDLNIKILLKEMCKFGNDLFPPLIDYIFPVLKNTFKLRNFKNAQVITRS